LTDAPDIVRFLLMLSSAQETVANCGSFVLAATSSDRKLAAQLASVIDISPPITTFLTCAQDGVFPELVDICMCVIPPEQWVLLPDDLEVIRPLPQNEDNIEIQQKAIARLAKQSVDPAPESVLAVERTFTFDQIEIAELDQKIRETEPATIANMRAFFWHPGGPLPDGFANEKSEEIVFRNALDVRL
jgi:hypothetical protein